MNKTFIYGFQWGQTIAIPIYTVLPYCVILYDFPLTGTTLLLANILCVSMLLPNCYKNSHLISHKKIGRVTFMLLCCLMVLQYFSLSCETLVRFVNTPESYIHFQVVINHFCISITSPQNNTYQAVLATNGNESYVFFLYNNLEWAYADNCSCVTAEKLPQVISLKKRMCMNCIHVYMHHYVQLFDHFFCMKPDFKGRQSILVAQLPLIMIPDCPEGYHRYIVQNKIRKARLQIHA